MTEQLSSRLTLVSKIVVCVWIAGAATGALAAIAQGPEGLIGGFVAAVLLVVFVKTFLPLRRVEITEEGLLVSTYVPREEVLIAFDEIAEVTRGGWVSPRPITLHLRLPGPFGDKVVFMPRVEPASDDSLHPVEALLRSKLALVADETSGRSDH